MRFMKFLSLCTVFIGTVIGAGFASGSEIWTFFGKYGFMGFFGVLLCSLIISICGGGILAGVYDGDFTSFAEFCKLLGGKKTGKFFSFLGVAFMYSALCIMISGSGALFSQEFGKSYLFGCLFMTVICFFVFITGVKGLAAINLFLTPFMIVGITLLGIFTILTHSTNVSGIYSDLLTVSESWVSVLIYVSYNILTVPAVIIPMKDYIFSRKCAVFAGISGGIVLGLCGLLMYFSVSCCRFSTQLPALSLAMSFSSGFGIFYGITLYFSMLTTALGNGCAVMEILKKKLPQAPAILLSFVICSSAVIPAMWGFANLVSSLYTIIGYGAVLLTFLLISYSLKKLKLSATQHQKPLLSQQTTTKQQ